MRLNLLKRRVCDSCGKVNPPTVKSTCSNGRPSRITACCLEDKGFYGPYDPHTLELVGKTNQKGRVLKYSNGKIWTETLVFEIKWPFKWR